MGSLRLGTRANAKEKAVARVVDLGAAHSSGQAIKQTRIRITPAALITRLRVALHELLRFKSPQLSPTPEGRFRVKCTPMKWVSRITYAPAADPGGSRVMQLITRLRAPEVNSTATSSLKP